MVKSLSRDHKPEDASEAARIRKSGGRVEQSRSHGNSEERYGPMRVWLKTLQVPGLAMTRSIGDLAAKKVGVLAEPELKIIKKLSRVDKFVVMGSDGLFDQLINEEIMAIVVNYYQHRDSEGAVNHLLQEAHGRWNTNSEVIDDITIVVAFLDCSNN